jgi:hypothetical protein
MANGTAEIIRPTLIQRIPLPPVSIGMLRISCDAALRRLGPAPERVRRIPCHSNTPTTMQTTTDTASVNQVNGTISAARGPELSR